MKLRRKDNTIRRIRVAPRRGAWIETNYYVWLLILAGGRTPQGCVD